MWSTMLQLKRFELPDLYVGLFWESFRGFPDYLALLVAKHPNIASAGPIAVVQDKRFVA